jgi:hypothetical protein
MSSLKLEASVATSGTMQPCIHPYRSGVLTWTGADRQNQPPTNLGEPPSLGGLKLQVLSIGILRENEGEMYIAVVVRGC